MKKIIFLSIFILFLSELIFPNILKVEPIPGQTYKIINNKQIVPFETAWQDIWKNINKLDYKQQIAVATYIINFINPDFTDAYIVRGDAYFATNNYIEAIADYTSAIKLQPNRGDLYYKRGLTFNYIKEFYPIAINDFIKAISLNDKKAEFYAEYSYVLKFSHYGADEILNKAISLNPQYKNFDYDKLEKERTDKVWQSAIKKAVFYSTIEKYQLANKYFDIANRLYYLPKLKNRNYNYIIQMMKSAVKSGNFEEAFYISKHFLTVSDLNNDDLAELYMYEAFACAGIYKKDLYAKYKNMSLNLAPQNPKIYWILGDIYRQIYNDTDSAIRSYQTALKLMPVNSPQYFELLITLAETYKKSGNIINAYSLIYNWLTSQKQMLSVSNPNPINAPIYLNYAKAYDILGNTQLAKIYYHTALALNSEYDIPTKYYPNKNEQITYLPSVIININDNTAVELNLSF